MDESVEELVCRAKQGQVDAFAALIRRFERSALAIAYACSGDADEAGDVVQEAFVRAWQSLSSLRQPQRFAPWLAGIVRNLAVDHRRQSQRRPGRELSLSQADDRAAADPAREAGRREINHRIAAALSMLDDLSRSAIVLRYYEGLGSRQIADLLDLTVAAVDMRLSRARLVLREHLADAAEWCEERR